MLFTLRGQKEEAIQFAAGAILGINNRQQFDPDLVSPTLNERCAKFQLKLSEWIISESDKTLADPAKQLIESIRPNEKFPAMLGANDIAVGKLLQDCVEKCPELPKAWSALGSWSYRWGRKMIESKTDSDGLSPIDLQAITQLIPEASNDEIQKILEILNQQQINVEEEDIGLNESSSTELIEDQLRFIPILSEKDSQFMIAIIELWKQAHRNVYGYYEMSANAYFKYLQISSGNEEESGDTSVVTATLRLLRLIVKHALGLQEVLEKGLAETPSLVS